MLARGFAKFTRFLSHNVAHVFDRREVGRSGRPWQDIDVHLFEPVWRSSGYVGMGIILSERLVFELLKI